MLLVGYDREDYYQEGSHVYKQLDVVEAFRRAMTTWGRWVDANVNPQKTHVFFRGYSASHFRSVWANIVLIFFSMYAYF